MVETLQRLATAVSLLELLELRRQAAGDPNLGSNIEQQLVSRELRDLEAQITLDPGPLAKYVVVPVTKRRQAAQKR